MPALLSTRQPRHLTDIMKLSNMFCAFSSRGLCIIKISNKDVEQNHDDTDDDAFAQGVDKLLWVFQF